MVSAKFGLLDPSRDVAVSTLLNSQGTLEDNSPDSKVSFSEVLNLLRFGF